MNTVKALIAILMILIVVFAVIAFTGMVLVLWLGLAISYEPMTIIGAIVYAAHLFIEPFTRLW